MAALVKGLVFWSAFATVAHGQGGQLDSPQEAHPVPKTYQGPTSSEERRARSIVTGALIYVPYSLVLPGKRGLTLGWVMSDDWTFGAEYQTADLGFSFQSVNFASIEETLELLTARRYFGNSFHLTFGFGQRRYEAAIGDDLLERWVPEGVPAHVGVLSARNEVALFGLGNHWQIGPGFTFGADWLDIYVTTGKGAMAAPFLDYVKDDDDRKTIRKVLKFFRYTPTFALARFDAGWTF